MSSVPTVAPRPTEHLPNTEALTLTGHEGPVLAVRFNNTGTYCLSCGKVTFPCSLECKFTFASLLRYMLHIPRSQACAI